MRLIDADALVKALNESGVPYRADVQEVLDAQPTIDAVPVVRCKDCIYYQDNNGGYPNADCKWCKDETLDANDYCSCGERK